MAKTGRGGVSGHRGSGGLCIPEESNLKFIGNVIIFELLTVFVLCFCFHSSLMNIYYICYWKTFIFFKNNCLLSLFRKLPTFSHLRKEISSYFGLNNYAIVIPFFCFFEPLHVNWFLQTTQPPLYFLVPSMFLMQNKKVSICMNY